MIHPASTTPARQTVITVRGEDWTVSYGTEEAQPSEPHAFYPMRATPAFGWVEWVSLGGKWYIAEEVFSSDMCGELDKALNASLF